VRSRAQQSTSTLAQSVSKLEGSGTGDVTAVKVPEVVGLGFPVNVRLPIEV
jgi:hypothetical protein